MMNRDLNLSIFVCEYVVLIIIFGFWFVGIVMFFLGVCLCGGGF